jgi:hypothetical protein
MEGVSIEMAASYENTNSGLRPSLVRGPTIKMRSRKDRVVAADMPMCIAT